MRIIYTETALCDLANIYEYQALNWQSVTLRFNMPLLRSNATSVIIHAVHQSYHAEATSEP